MTSEELDIVVERLGEVVREHVRLLVREEYQALLKEIENLSSRALTSGPLAPVRKLCGRCGWAGVTTSTTCGTCGRWLTLTDEGPA